MYDFTLLCSYLDLYVTILVLVDQSTRGRLSGVICFLPSVLPHFLVKGPRVRRLWQRKRRPYHLKDLQTSQKFTRVVEQVSVREVFMGTVVYHSPWSWVCRVF